MWSTSSTALPFARMLAPRADICGWFARDVATFACVGEVLLNASLPPSLSVRLLAALPSVRIKLEAASNAEGDDDFTDLTGLVLPCVVKIVFSPSSVAMVGCRI